MKRGRLFVLVLIVVVIDLSLGVNKVSAVISNPILQCLYDKETFCLDKCYDAYQDCNIECYNTLEICKNSCPPDESSCVNDCNIDYADCTNRKCLNENGVCEVGCQWDAPFTECDFEGINSILTKPDSELAEGTECKGIEIRNYFEEQTCECCFFNGKDCSVYGVECYDFSVYFKTDEDWLKERAIDIEEYKKPIQLKGGDSYNVIVPSQKMICEATTYAGNIPNTRIFKIIDENNNILKTFENVDCEEVNDFGDWKEYKCEQEFTLEEFRGKNVQCQAVIGEETEISDEEYVVAKYVHLFVQILFTREVYYRQEMEEEYAYFLERTYFNEKVDEMAKPVYLRIPYDSISKAKEKISCSHYADAATSICLAGAFLDDELERIGSQLNIDPKYDRIMSFSQRGNPQASRRYSHIVHIADPFISTLAHELGHTYFLCDEYYQEYYKLQTHYHSIPCLNEYPSCAADNLNNNKVKVEISCLPIAFSDDTIDCFDCAANGGICLEEGQRECPDNYFLINSNLFYRTCFCCLTEQRMKEVGNNCWPLNFDYLKTNTEGIMFPLRIAGSPIPDKNDLNSDSRSIMGDFLYRKYRIGQSYYPEGSPYPLKVGKP